MFAFLIDKTAMNLMDEVLRNKSASTKLYAGLFVTFMGGAEEDLIRQVHETRKVNLGGVIIFDYAHFAEKYKKILSCSAFDASQCKVSVPKTVSSYKTDNK